MSVALRSLELLLVDSIVLMLLYVVEPRELLDDVEHFLVQLHLLFSWKLSLYALARLFRAAAARLPSFLLLLVL